MKLSEVEFEEIMDWLNALDQDTHSCRDAIRETMMSVPAVDRLMHIIHNAQMDGADETMLMRTRDINNTLIALYQLEQGHTPPKKEKKQPSRTSTRSCARQPRSPRRKTG
jgi:hypothetical protein